MQKASSDIFAAVTRHQSSPAVRVFKKDMRPRLPRHLKSQLKQNAHYVARLQYRETFRHLLNRNHLHPHKSGFVRKGGNAPAVLGIVFSNR